jgi:threonine/homoserine/homoserine lactone efflux protein
MQRVFAEGVLVSVLNPKIAVFFLAFLPQFVDPARGPVPQQVAMLGLLYVAMALVTDGGYALLAARVREWLGARVLHGPLPRYASGFLYLGLGVSMAVSGQRKA